MNQSNTEKTKSWNRFYQIAGTAALLIVLMGMVDVVVSMSAGEAQENSAIAVTEWFALLQTNRFAALCNLGLINIITLRPRRSAKNPAMTEANIEPPNTAATMTDLFSSVIDIVRPR